MNAELLTDGGEFVANLTIPPFQIPPGVVIWGSRVFSFKQLSNGSAVYREAFAFWVAA